ncbi:MAG: CoA-binding protein [Candidatus Nanopelagicaceae bacterium]|nr:CoA-binding protein [Candidatus Nanopelagicaceae bacterium]
MNTTETISQILALKNWAVVGLANNSDRPAFGVSKLLKDKGHQIFPVHPKAEIVHGEVGYHSLADIPVQIDVVDCFVNSNLVGAVVDQAIAIGAKAVWLQLGVIDEAAIARAQAAGLLTVMDRCPAIEYQRFN